MHETKKNKEYLEKLIHYITKKHNIIPIGALIIQNNKIISIATNANTYGINHAECIAINKAQKYLENNLLLGCTLYTTLEPCMMCVGHAINAGIKTIYFGCMSDKSGIQSFFNVYNINTINIIHITGYQNKIKSIMKDFFAQKRNRLHKKNTLT